MLMTIKYLLVITINDVVDRVAVKSIISITVVIIMMMLITTELIKLIMIYNNDNSNRLKLNLIQSLQNCH